MAIASTGGLAYVTNAGGGAGGGAAISIGGNTAGTAALVSSGTLVLAGGTNVTLSQSGSTVSIVGAAGAVGTGFTSSTTAGTALVGTLSSNGLSLGVPAWITTAVGQTTGGLYALGANTTQNSSTTLALSALSFSGGGAMTVGFSNGTIQMSAPVTSSLSVTGLLSLSVNGSTISIGDPGPLISANGSSVSASSIVLSNSNGFTFGLSTGAGAGTVTASYANAALAGTNTAVTGNASITLNSSGLSFNGSGLAGTSTGITGNAAITLNSSGLAFNGSGLAGTNTAKTGNIAFTVNSSGVSINASSLGGTGFTTGSTTGANFSGTINSNGLSLVQPFRTRMIVPYGNLTQISAPGNASLSIQYIQNDVAITGTRIDALFAMSAGSAATTATAALAFSAYAVIYTRNVSTLSSLSSGSTQTTYTYASNTAGNTQFTGSNIYPMSVPVNFNMAPGEYFVGFNMITATSSVGLSTTNLGATISMMGGNAVQTTLNYAEITNATATSSNLFGGAGVYTAATTGAPVSIGLAAIAQTGSSLSQANIALVFRNA